MSQEPSDNREISRYPDMEKVGLLRGLFENIRLSWKLLWDNRVPFWAKLTPLFVLVYLFSPIDILPEIAAVVNPLLTPLLFADDITLIIGALALFVQMSPPDVVTEHRRALRAKLPRSTSNDDVVEGYAESVED